MMRAPRMTKSKASWRTSGNLRESRQLHPLLSRLRRHLRQARRRMELLRLIRRRSPHQESRFGTVPALVGTPRGRLRKAFVFGPRTRFVPWAAYRNGVAIFAPQASGLTSET